MSGFAYDEGHDWQRPPEDPEIVAGHKRGELHDALTKLVLDHGLIEVDAMLLVVKDDLEGVGA